MNYDPKDLHIRVINKRIGAGIGGFDKVVRLQHTATGILIEVPRVSSAQSYDIEIAIEMLKAALTHPKLEKEGH